MSVRAVLDCNVILQAVLSPRGPAFACFRLVDEGALTPLLCPAVVAEVRDVLSRPALRRANPQLTPERVAVVLALLARRSEHHPDPRTVFPLPRDPKDEPYLNLAISAGAAYLVSWNERHMGYLTRADTPDGRDFVARWPALRIVTPPVFLREIGGSPRAGA